MRQCPAPRWRPFAWLISLMCPRPDGSQIKQKKHLKQFFNIVFFFFKFKAFDMHLGWFGCFKVVAQGKESAEETMTPLWQHTPAWHVLRCPASSCLRCCQVRCMRCGTLGHPNCGVPPKAPDVAQPVRFSDLCFIVFPQRCKQCSEISEISEIHDVSEGLSAREEADKQQMLQQIAAGHLEGQTNTKTAQWQRVLCIYIYMNYINYKSTNPSSQGSEPSSSVWSRVTTKVFWTVSPKICAMPVMLVQLEFILIHTY